MTRLPQNLIKGGWSNPILTRGLRFLEKPAVKYTALSVGTMGIPRAWVDFNRTDAMGWETVRYEAAGTTTNYLLPGFLAAGLAKVVEKVNNPEKLNLSFWANNDSVNALYENWKQTGNTEDFIKRTMHQIGGLGDDFINEQAHQLNFVIKNPKHKKSLLNGIKRKIGVELGTRDRIVLDGSGLHTSVDKLVDNMYDLAGKIFTKSKNLDDAVHRVKFANNFKTVGALAIAGSLTFGIQFINRFITKQKTGIDGYVGYSELKDQLSQEHWDEGQKKTGLSFGSIGADYGFDGFFPNNTQIAGFMAPLSFVGGVSASRDKNEFFERLIRGGAALVNLFFIPGIAGKAVVRMLKEKDDIFTDPGHFWRTKIKSYTEIIDAYAPNIIKKNNMDDKAAKEFVDRLVKAKNKAEVAKLAYAIIAVGLAIPTFTKILVDKKHEKDLASQGLKANGPTKNSLINKKFGIIENISQNSDNPFEKFVKERTI